MHCCSSAPLDDYEVLLLAALIENEEPDRLDLYYSSKIYIL